MKRLGLIFLMIFFLIRIAMSQDLTYDILLKNKQVGEINAKKIQNAGAVEYFLESEASYSLIFSIDYSYTIRSVFADNMLTNSYAENMVNDKLKASSTTEYAESGYSIDLIDEEKKIILGPIRFSMVELYFVEPHMYSEVYSERYGQFLDLVDLNNNQYMVVLPDGKEIIYKYKNGKCIEVEVDYPLANLYFKLRESRLPSVSSY